MNGRQFIKSALLWIILWIFSFVIVYLKPSNSLNADVLQPKENLWDIVVQPKESSIIIRLNKQNPWSKYEWLFFWDSTQADVTFSQTSSDWDVVWQDVWPWAKKFSVWNLKWDILVNVPVSWSSEMIVISDVKSLIWSNTTSLSITSR